MEIEQKVKTLQMVYAGALADSVLRLGREGILEKVVSEKREEQMRTGRERAAQFNIKAPGEVFEKLSEIFECANWKVEENNNGCCATATRCMLCAMAKRMGAQSPCRIYCLDAMEAMVKGFDPDMEYNVRETLWDGSKCVVELLNSNK
jgi:hypothetical protein